MKGRPANLPGAAWAALLLLVVAAPATASQLSLVVNGKAFHYDDRGERELNERNYGLGLQYDFGRRGAWRPLLTAGTFRDSLDDSAWYAGGGALRRFPLRGTWHIGLGAVALVMRHSDIHDYRPFVALLPAVTLGTDAAALNLTWIPRVKAKGAAALFVQLRLALWRDR